VWRIRVRRQVDQQRQAVLYDLGYVIECASMQCFGEGKAGLHRLCDRRRRWRVRPKAPPMRCVTAVRRSH